MQKFKSCYTTAWNSTGWQRWHFEAKYKHWIVGGSFLCLGSLEVELIDKILCNKMGSLAICVICGLCSISS